MKEYVIFKGWHYAFFLIGRLFGWHYDDPKFSIDFKFSNECWWNPPRNSDDYDLNKLGGISFGLLTIHKNSVRLTWVPNFEKPGYIKLYGYVYNPDHDGHISQYICDVKTEQEYTCTIYLNSDNYVFDMGELGKIQMERTKYRKIQKMVYPYFGGDNRSPVKMSIWMDVKK